MGMGKQQKSSGIIGAPFRVIFNTADGSKIMDRGGIGEYYFMDNHRITPNKEFINLTLKRDGSMKGVRVVKYDLTSDALTAIVEWL
jgi:hypothetical protein